MLYNNYIHLNFYETDLCPCHLFRHSLRRHRHAAQHWMIVDGIAQVTLEDQQHTLNPGESISIPAGAAHALATTDDRPLSLIEVQAGPNAGKDEFERLENT